MIRMSPGEVCDRFTILRMKAERDPTLNSQVSEYLFWVRHYITQKPWIIGAVVDIAEANAKIWMLEADIRNHKKMKMDEVGRRAILIRDHNAKRVSAKAYIDNQFGNTPDLKFDHISAK